MKTVRAAAWQAWPSASASSIPTGGTHTKEVKLYDVMSLPSLKEVTNAIHRHNCRAVMELAHGGKYAGARSHGDPSYHHTVYGPNDEINPEGLACDAP